IFLDDDGNHGTLISIGLLIGPIPICSVLGLMGLCERPYPHQSLRSMESQLEPSDNNGITTFFAQLPLNHSSSVSRYMHPVRTHFRCAYTHYLINRLIIHLNITLFNFKHLTTRMQYVSAKIYAAVASLNLGQLPQDTSPKDRIRDEPLGESVYSLKKERSALRMDKNILLINKRRLEGVLTKLLEQPLPWEEMGQQALHQQPAGGTDSERSGNPMVLRASSIRAQVLKALDDSTSLEKQLMAGPGGAASAFEAEIARSLDLSEKMADMQAAHEIAISRLEGELSYRRTQAAAATTNLQKQLNEAQEELGRLKEQLAGAEAEVRELTQQGADLRKQTHNLNNALTEKSKMLAETRDMLGMDKGTLATIIEMLKEQLRDASADRAAKSRLISELEYAIVHRDALLTEAHDRMNQAAAQAAAAAAAGVSSSAAVARVAASMQAPLDAKGSW
ncbi:hypothetical protein VaNZ11_005422, partial [Volvox africanus]